MDQLSFASLDYAAKKKRTKRDAFLAEMMSVVPWLALEAVIEPHYLKAGPTGGRRPCVFCGAEHLKARGALLRGGTIVDATLIAAYPASTVLTVSPIDSESGNQRSVHHRGRALPSYMKVIGFGPRM